MMIPRSRISAESSGGVMRRACFTVSIIVATGSFSASRISSLVTVIVRGTPAMTSRPLTSHVSSFSSERGLNENTNGLIRQYYPKGKNLRDVTKNELQKIMSRLNNRPRKTLDYKLPKILFKLDISKIALVA